MALRKYVNLLFVLFVTILIKFFSLFPDAVERYYSDGVYPFISRTQRIITGWVPVSVGDIIYFSAGLYLLVKSIGLIKKLFKELFAPKTQQLSKAEQCTRCMLPLPLRAMPNGAAASLFWK